MPTETKNPQRNKILSVNSFPPRGAWGFSWGIWSRRRKSRRHWGGRSSWGGQRCRQIARSAGGFPLNLSRLFRSGPWSGPWTRSSFSPSPHSFPGLIFCTCTTLGRLKWVTFPRSAMHLSTMKPFWHVLLQFRLFPSLWIATLIPLPISRPRSIDQFRDPNLFPSHKVYNFFVFSPDFSDWRWPPSILQPSSVFSQLPSVP